MNSCAWRLHPKTKKARKGNVGTGLNGGWTQRMIRGYTVNLLSSPRITVGQPGRAHPKELLTKRKCLGTWILSFGVFYSPRDRKVPKAQPTVHSSKDTSNNSWKVKSHAVSFLDGIFLESSSWNNIYLAFTFSFFCFLEDILRKEKEKCSYPPNINGLEV